MNVVAHADPVAVSAGWKWLAVLIGLGVLAVIALVAALPAKGKLWQLVAGEDGRASTSKFQWLLWLVVIAFAYVVLWVLRARQGDYAALSQVPVNLLTVLGFSTGTAAIAKGITVGYVQSSKVTKPPAGQGSKGGLIQDDSGIPDLGKLQIIAFTVIAVGIFLVTLIHQIVSNPVITTLPNIDSSLLVLMGISQGGYLGKKLVTFSSPVLYPPATAASPTQPFTVTGANLGGQAGLPQPAGALLTLDGKPVETSDWSPTAVTFTVPAAAAPAPAHTERTVELAAFVAGQKSNVVPLTVGAAPASVAVSSDGAGQQGTVGTKD